MKEDYLVAAGVGGFPRKGEVAVGSKEMGDVRAVKDAVAVGFEVAGRLTAHPEDHLAIDVAFIDKGDINGGQKALPGGDASFGDQRRITTFKLKGGEVFRGEDAVDPCVVA